MIYSMTGFARGQDHGDWGMATWEIRSVNHRYLDPSFRMPDSLRELEMSLRESLQSELERGRVECSLRFRPGVATDLDVSVNAKMAESVITASQDLGKLLDNPESLRVMDLLRWPDVVEIETRALESAKQPLLALFKKTILDLSKARQQEGEALQQMIETRLNTVEAEVAKIVELSPFVTEQYRKKLEALLESVKTELDQERLEQELVLFSQKVDITEEIDRLGAHIIETRRILKDGGPIGRRLDFLMQEFNREVNTIGSKASNKDITKSVVEMKVLIEQMREQVQNIE